MQALAWELYILMKAGTGIRLKKDLQEIDV
jgi:hypothetical protein